MAFWLKKVAEYWLMPVPFCLALLAPTQGRRFP
jgi:hypothetical protein